MPKTQTRLSTPKGVKPTKILAKRNPTNQVNAEYSSGCLVVDEDADRYELHVTDGQRAAAVKLTRDNIPVAPDEKPDRVTSGQIPAPAIRELERGGFLEQADKDEVRVWCESDDADMITSRDPRLFDSHGDVGNLIPNGDGTEILLNVDRLKELGEALGSRKLILTCIEGEDRIRVQTLDNENQGSFMPLRRHSDPGPEPAGEATEPLIPEGDNES